MNLLRRQALLACLALPAGCRLSPLQTVSTQPIATPPDTSGIRPPALGQSWTYEKFNGFDDALLATEIEEVAALNPRIVIRRRTLAGVTLPEEHHLGWGQLVREVSWDRVQNYDTPVPLWPQRLAVGEMEDVRSNYRVDDFSFTFWIQVQARVSGWEKVSIASGEFNALKIERRMILKHIDISRSSTTRWDTLWLVPDIGRFAVREISGEYIGPGRRGGGREDMFRWELKSWT